MDPDIKRLGTFRVELIEWNQSNKLKMGEHLKVHDDVVRPILKAAHECFVFGVKKNSPVLKHCKAILTPTRGKHAVDLSQEVISGFEPLWNSSAPDRGSIVAAVEPAKFKPAILARGRRSYVLGNPQAANTLSAIKYCRSLAAEGQLAFCFDFHSARGMQVYGPPKLLQDLYASVPARNRGIMGSPRW
jgi:hypothetical protein